MSSSEHPMGESMRDVIVWCNDIEPCVSLEETYDALVRKGWTPPPVRVPEDGAEGPTWADVEAVAARLGYEVDAAQCGIQGTCVEMVRPVRPGESLFGMPVAGPVRYEVVERHFWPHDDSALPEAVARETDRRAFQRAIWDMESDAAGEVRVPVEARGEASSERKCGLPGCNLPSGPTHGDRCCGYPKCDCDSDEGCLSPSGARAHLGQINALRPPAPVSEEPAGFSVCSEHRVPVASCARCRVSFAPHEIEPEAETPFDPVDGLGVVRLPGHPKYEPPRECCGGRVESRGGVVTEIVPCEDCPAPVSVSERSDDA